MSVSSRPSGPRGEGNLPHRLTLAELEAWGRALGRAAAEEGVFVCLVGGLGVGKSTLARAACRGAGVAGLVPSPTFTLVNRYIDGAGRLLHHADLYRIDTPEELSDIGWEDLVGADGAVFVEWAERAGDRLPADRWEIQLAFDPDSDHRQVDCQSMGGVAPMPAVPG